MIKENFLNYKGFRWMWFHLILVAVMITLYLRDEPRGGRRGSTVLGYSYGGIATAAILYLLWFGLRKRSHYSRLTTLKGCLAVHVWLGIALAIIVPLHCAFRFGSNVHTFAYVLMLGVIASGVVGARLYLVLPQKVMSHRGGGTTKVLLEELHSLSQKIDWLARERSDEFLALLEHVDFAYVPGMWHAIFGAKPEEPLTKDVALLLSRIDDPERAEAVSVIAHAKRKRELVAKIQEEVRVMALFRTWLYVHIPLSYGLVMAVAVHIFSELVMR